MQCLFCGVPGDGAYSEVYKVKRLSDQQMYALKKVSLLSDDRSSRVG